MRIRYKSQAGEAELAFSLRMLSQMLAQFHGVAPVIIIDEYDTPIQHGYAKGFYDEVVGFMRNLLSGGLKDNEYLSFGFLTGILRVAKESIFSGLNNLKVNSVVDGRYGRYFGFTADEVKALLGYYGAAEKYGEVCEWYDGYRFGDEEIFNPWSVLSYLGNACMARPYWENTGDNSIVGEIMAGVDAGTMGQLTDLMQGDEVEVPVDTEVVYPEVRSNPTSVFGFLLFAGYLKVMGTRTSAAGDLLCRVKVPNLEVAHVYRVEVIHRFSGAVVSAANSMRVAIESKDVEGIRECIRRFLLESTSYIDLTSENSYHMLLLGLVSAMNDRYRLRSNRESGEGRFDIELEPIGFHLPGIIVEVKVGKDADDRELDRLAHEALAQIDDRGYATDMESKGVRTIIRYGFAFSGKRVKVAMG